MKKYRINYYHADIDMWHKLSVNAVREEIALRLALGYIAGDDEFKEAFVVQVQEIETVVYDAGAGCPDFGVAC